MTQINTIVKLQTLAITYAMGHYLSNLSDLLDEHEGDTWGTFKSLESLLDSKEATRAYEYEDVETADIVGEVTSMANGLMTQYAEVKDLVDEHYVSLAIEDEFPMDLNELSSMSLVPKSITWVECEVVASWDIPFDPTLLGGEWQSEFHVSQGQDQEDQGLGYFSTDEGAKLILEQHADDTWTVTLYAPSQGLEYCPDHWLSANQIVYEGETYEGTEEIREVQA